MFSLCREMIKTIVPMLGKFTHAEVNSVLLFISLLASEKSNREKLTHFDYILKQLVNILEQSPVAEARNLAANVLEALSREDVNKAVMGRELLRLLDYFSSVNDQCSDIRKNIWNLCVDCPANILMILKSVDTPLKLLHLSANRLNIAFPSMMVLMELAELEEGKRALMGAGAVVTLINMTREGTGDEEHCLSLMYQIQTCKGNNELFKTLAVSAEAEEVLLQNKEWGEMGREKARRMLEFIELAIRSLQSHLSSTKLYMHSSSSLS
ncbi:uncharacterized protein LOC109833537 [Asparagus officinalis]|uniref:uncharacterized protein LOC109833537 n=1 Tax=Asparagus officinalis TaxID=4686 RepID=UPI00098E6F59|nr:uncharacterized protein LOC109833537 [Asparagus officinalis]